jgi:glutaredoxin 3
MQAVIWSKDFCGYCDRAKRLLEQKGIKYEERKIGSGWTKEQLLESVPTARTVPQIFLDDKLIGGHDDLVKYFNEAK